MAEPISVNAPVIDEDAEDRLRLRDILNDKSSQNSANTDDAPDLKWTGTVHRGNVSTDGQQATEQVAKSKDVHESFHVPPPTFAEIDQGFNAAGPVRGIELPGPAEVRAAPFRR